MPLSLLILKVVEELFMMKVALIRFDVLISIFVLLVQKSLDRIVSNFLK